MLSIADMNIPFRRTKTKMARRLLNIGSSEISNKRKTIEFIQIQFFESCSQILSAELRCEVLEQ